MSSRAPEFIPGAIEISETLAPEILCSSSEAEMRPGTKSKMKAINIQIPARLTKRVLFPGGGPPWVAGHPKLLIERNGRRCWYTFFRSLRTLLAGVLDCSAYDQVSLGREVSVAFTSPGPLIYRYVGNTAQKSGSVARETDHLTEAIPGALRQK